MSTLIFYAIAAVAMPMQTKSVDPRLGASTPEGQACQNEKLASANKTLAMYMAAARQVATKIDADVGPNTVSFGVLRALDQSAQSWEKYRHNECTAVARKYTTGTYAGVAATICETCLTKLRAYTLWEEWVVAFDGSTKLPPPPLPTPARYHLYNNVPGSIPNDLMPPH